jgi:YVTN family beta-propeller protein
MAYVACDTDGTIVGIPLKQVNALARIQAEPGLGQIKFFQEGRLGFIVNPVSDRVYIIDVATNRIVQTLNVKGAPDQVSFSESLAYIRRNKSDTVAMIPIAQVSEGKPVSTAEFPGGQHLLGQTARPSPADSIIPAPGEGAVLVANPADKSIYYYMEGMAAPVGNFSNYGREPRAVLVVDRSFKEQAPGLYKTVAKVTRPGLYDVLFLLDSPRIVHCFQVTVDSNPDAEAKAGQGGVRIESLLKENRVKTGQTTTLKFRFSDSATGKLRTGLADVQVLVFLAPGIWQTRGIAKEVSQGIYSMDFIPPRPGIYYIHLSSAALGLPLNNPQFSMVEATPAPP